jgi:hypothetical protein
MRKQRVLSASQCDRVRPVCDLACAGVDGELVAAQDTGAREYARTWGIPRACLRCAIDHDRDPAEQNGVADHTHVVEMLAMCLGRASVGHAIHELAPTTGDYDGFADKRTHTEECLETVVHRLWGNAQLGAKLRC